MTTTNEIVSAQTPSIKTPNKKKKFTKNTFTKLQSAALILLTLVISVAGWYQVGVVYFWNDRDMKRVDAQLEYLKQQSQAKPTDPKTRVELGYTFYLKGNNAQAIQELNQAVLLDPKNFDGYYNLGLVMLRDKRYNEALTNFQKATELSPKDYKAILQKGVTYRNMKMYKEATVALGQADKLLPGSADIIYETGQVAEAQGDKAAAADMYKQALSYDPLFKEAVTALERVSK